MFSVAQRIGAETTAELWLNLPNAEEENVLPSTSGDSCAASTSQNHSKGGFPFEPMPSTSKQAMDEILDDHRIAQKSVVKQETMKSEPKFDMPQHFNTMGDDLGGVHFDQIDQNQHHHLYHQHKSHEQSSRNILNNLSTENYQNASKIASNDPNTASTSSGQNSRFLDKNTQNGQSSQNLDQTLQNQPQLPTMNIKVEPSASESSAAPQLRICDQNSVSSSNSASNKSSSSNTPTLPVMNKAPRRFIKCVSKDGKFSLMELVQDEKNPKLFKMVIPQGVQAKKGSTQVPQIANRPMAPIVLSATNSAKNVVPSPNIPVVSMNATPSMVSAGGIRLPVMNMLGKIVQTNSMQSLMKSSPVAIQKPSISIINSPANVSNASLGLSNSTANSANSFISSLGLPNAAANLPKLVAINSSLPSKGPANTTSQLVSTIASKSALVQNPNFTSVTGIIQKNNKMLVLDPSQMSKNQKQSLLKPQVSLLKPRFSAQCSNNHKKVTVTNITGIESKNINVFVPADIKITQSKHQNVAPPRQCHKDELEKRFLARPSFGNMTEAIGWLLKEIPLISPLAAETDFRTAFPFVVASLTDFQRLLVVKQRSFEVILIISYFYWKIFNSHYHNNLNQ